MRKIPNHLKKAYKEAIQKGWTVAYTKGSHLKWTRPDGLVCITASTPGCERGGRNEMSRLKRMGLEL